MVTRCFFDEEDFKARNNCSVVVSSVAKESGLVKIEIMDRDGKLENEVTINGRELAIAIKNCTNKTSPWGEF